MALFSSRKNQNDTSEQNLNYWDIHNHILPGVDDGSSCVEESLDMVEEEYRQGIRNIVFTPHYRPGMFTVDAAVRERVYLQFSDKVRERHPDMHFYLGCEVYAHNSMHERLQDIRYRMAGTSAVLMEFSTSGHFRDMETLIRQTLDQGYQPVMAHVERYECLYADEDRIYRLKDMGALVQVNAGSILEGRFSHRRKFVQALLDDGAVDFIASDAHDLDYRPVRMRECMQVITKQYGRKTADKLFRANPARMFGDH